MHNYCIVFVFCQQIGFNAGDGQLYNLFPGYVTSTPVDLVTGSNAAGGDAGCFVFQMDVNTVASPGDSSYTVM